MDSRVRMALCPSTWISTASTPERAVAAQAPSALSPMALALETTLAAVREDSAPETLALDLERQAALAPARAALAPDLARAACATSRTSSAKDRTVATGS